MRRLAAASEGIRTTVTHGTFGRSAVERSPRKCRLPHPAMPIMCALGIGVHHAAVLLLLLLLLMLLLYGECGAARGATRPPSNAVGTKFSRPCHWGALPVPR